MQTEVISGSDLRKMLASALTCLEQKYKEIDLLNVFPVPDGDTGTNMFLTLTSAVGAITGDEDASVGRVAEAASSGALMGARGNSGVILSQLLRGLAKKLKNIREATVKEFALALDEGVRVASGAVIKPVEGTILTVAREAAKQALKTAEQGQSVHDFFQEVLQTAEATLNKTPEMLPALKEAGVVDAGGMGWLVILQGFAAGLSGQAPKILNVPVSTGETGSLRKQLADKETGLQYPYCTELLIRASALMDGELRAVLQNKGDSLLVAGDGEFVKVHIHTAHPGEVIEACLTFGTLTDVKINNMDEQIMAHKGPGNQKGFGIVSVAIGPGITAIMESLGADKVTVGGQTMNPSTQDLLEAVEKIDSDKVIILPNNKNIIMTAGQVGTLTDKNVEIIPTRTMPQGIAALLASSGKKDFTEALEAMKIAYDSVTTLEITYAVRDTKVNGNDITNGSIIGLIDNNLLQSGGTVPEVVIPLMEQALAPEHEICTIYYGDSVLQTEAEELLTQLEERFPDLEFELQDGGQPVYFYIISLE